MKIYDIELKTAQGETMTLDKYKGQVMLIVNTASKCGFTPQFEGLEALYQKHKDEGFVVLGFPCNQFKEQDPESIDKIVEFCTTEYGVTFPMFDKIDVNGENAHPLYQYLKQQKKGMFKDDIKWNFTKFLVDKDGEVISRYAPQKKPENIEKDIIELLKG